MIRRVDGREADRTYGWDRAEWERVSGFQGIGAGLPAFRPGCGALNIEPGTIEDLLVRFEETGLTARRVELGDDEDEFEATFERGWSDGLPVVPPTERRVLRMLTGTTRDPRELVGLCPPNLAPLTVEKIAINAVMAGCKPEYLPVVLAAVEAALDPAFSMHGVLATTMFVGPVLVVNGPVRRQIGMNARGNALGQGNRANATIGRALQLIIRNVGGGRPQEVDRATLGNPGKYTYCFAEDEEGSCWEPLSVERGVAPGVSAVTVFAGFGLQGVVDQKSRDPESLSRSFAESLKAIHNVKLAPACDAMLVVCPEHERTFRTAGWSKARLLEELSKLCEIPGDMLVAGARGIAEGHSPAVAGHDAEQVSSGWVVDRARRRWRRDVLGHYRRLVLRRPGRVSARNQGGEIVTVLLDPTSEQSPASRERLPRPEQLRGLTVGLLDISKPRGDVFLDRLDARLTDLGITVKRYMKPTVAKPAPLPLRQQIVGEVNVVIEGLAD